VGQQIEIKSSVVLGDVLVIDTDRSLTGQNGEAFGQASEAVGSTLGAKLANVMFALLPGTDHVFTASNTLSVRSTDVWTDEAVDAANGAVRNFFTYWSDNRT
jgi:hypothetical protein